VKTNKKVTMDSKQNKKHQKTATTKKQLLFFKPELSNEEKHSFTGTKKAEQISGKMKQKSVLSIKSREKIIFWHHHVSKLFLKNNEKKQTW
jgi:hypothetical protein